MGYDLSAALRRPTGVWHEGKRHLGLWYLMLDGVAATVYFNMTSAFLVAYALALGGGAFYIGLLSAVPAIFWTLSLLPAAVLAQKFALMRKHQIVVAATASRLVWVFILLVPVLFAADALATLLVLVTLATAVGAFSNPSFASLVGDLVPDNMRGRYFGRRTIWSTLFGLGASLAAGLTLDIFGYKNLEGFAIVFAAGIGAGLLSSFFLARIPSPPIRVEKDLNFRKAFGDALDNRSFRKSLLLLGFWQFGVMFASPFFNVQLLEYLRADYIWISILAVIGGLAAVLTQKMWGLFSDAYGHRIIIVIGTLGITFVPFLWLFPQPETLWLVAPIEIFTAFFWAGFTLAHYNYMLEVSPPSERATFSALFSAVLGLAGIVGPIAGGLAIDYFGAGNALFGFTDVKANFLIATVLRGIAGISLLLFLSEVTARRERVQPGYVMAQMLRYGIQGGIKEAHHAAGVVKDGVRRVEASVAHAGVKAGLETKKARLELGDMASRAAHKTDVQAEKIVEGAEQANEPFDAKTESQGGKE
jgi:MFS family permease